MVQVFQPSPYAMQQGQIGQALGLGVAKNFQDPQQRVQQNLLQNALSQLPEDASYLDVLKTAGPQLMTTPGGPQLLAELGPILQKQNQGKAALEYLKKYYPEGGGNLQQDGTTQPPVTTNQEIHPGGEAYFRDLKPPIGKEGTYPKMAAGPEPIPLMTPQEVEQRKGQMIAISMAQGQPADPIAIENAIQNEQNRRITYNQKVEEARLAREEKQQQQSARMMKRFEQSSAVPRSEEDKVVFEKFANEAKDAANENEGYQYARAKYNQFDNARNALLREADIPNIAQKIYRSALGTTKSKENVIKDLQPHIKKLKDLGLENQARAILSDSVGLGMEDTELAMYPLTTQEKLDYNKFKINPNVVKKPSFEKGYLTQEIPRFPGEESALPQEKFIEFKESIGNILQRNPKANLVGMRGIVNNEKKYAWTDYSRAVVELIDEGRFNPDPIQEQQLLIIKSAPIPGMSEMFTEFWKGTR